MRPNHGSRHTGRIVVRLAPEVIGRIPDRDRKSVLSELASLQQLAESLGLRALRRSLQECPPLPSYRAVRPAPVARAYQPGAAVDPAYSPIYSLASYFLADPREWKSPEQAAQFLAGLKALKSEIGVAYRELTVRTAGSWRVDPDDPFVKDQGYLDAAPKGIGVKTKGVWGSFNGAGIGFVDLEAGWNLEHADLPQATASPQPMIHKNDDTLADHGTAVLGVVVAKKNGDGITGIAPGADFRGVASYVVNLRRADPGVAEAIEAAVDVLRPGDVLLLEVETGDGYPIETDELVFNAIRDAVRNGIIVIEAAGNGTEVEGRDLDRVSRRPGGPPPINLKRGNASFQDSGAIMVSACRANLALQGGHRRIGYAGFGSRIDCHAWGEKVVTAGVGDFGPIAGANRRYTDGFGGTSAAAAIIAGAAILVQEIAKSSPGGRPLKPAEMRTILSDSETGTVILAPRGSKKVGVMPDLEKIAQKLGAA